MWSQVRPAILSLLLLTAITGLFYPLAVTGIAHVVFPKQANGSLVMRNGVAVGSTLIGQPFDEPKYFWGRPSATSPYAYNATSSSGSNLGPTNEALKKAVTERIATLKAADPDTSAKIPVDLVTTSGSGLDPHISPASAEYQVRRVARVRGMNEDAVRRLVTEHTEGRQWGVLGESRVNVLELNLALNSLH
jgi:K+-transporting ATPase ATPase C chain